MCDDGISEADKCSRREEQLHLYHLRGAVSPGRCCALGHFMRKQHNDIAIMRSWLTELHQLKTDLKIQKLSFI